MGSMRDVDGRERAMISALAELEGARVLEVGAGDGRLTWCYARRARSVLAIEPAEAQLARARAATPIELEGRVRFETARIETLPLERASFEVVFFSGSL